MKQSNLLKKNLITAMLTMLMAFAVLVSATFAWYIYNTSAHTTDVHMAAGSSVSLSISNSYNGAYGSSTILESFKGLLNPVSTNRIRGGFQKVYGFTNGSETQPMLVANLFGKAEGNDYYRTSLFIKTSGGDVDLYVSDIGFEDSSKSLPLSTAIRVGLVVHEQGKDKPTAGEYIFAINSNSNPEKQYNTATGREGYVLDSSKTDGSTVPFTPYTKENFCKYDSNTGEVSLNSKSLKICSLKGDSPVEIEIYIWLEGCDEDCTVSLASQSMNSIAISFGGY